MTNCPDKSDSESDSSINQRFLGWTLDGLGSDRVEELVELFSFLFGAMVRDRIGIGIVGCRLTVLTDL